MTKQIRTMNKKGAQIGSMFIAAVLVSFMITATLLIVNEYSLFYNGSNSGINIPGSENFNKLNDTSNQFRSITSTNNPDQGSNFESNLFRLSYGVITNIFLPLDIAYDMLLGISQTFKLPHYISYTIILLLVFAIVFSLIALIMRLFRTKA